MFTSHIFHTVFGWYEQTFLFRLSFSVSFLNPINIHCAILWPFTHFLTIELPIGVDLLAPNYPSCLSTILFSSPPPPHHVALSDRNSRTKFNFWGPENFQLCPSEHVKGCLLYCNMSYHSSQIQNPFLQFCTQTPSRSNETCSNRPKKPKKPSSDTTDLHCALTDCSFVILLWTNSSRTAVEPKKIFQNPCCRWYLLCPANSGIISSSEIPVVENLIATQRKGRKWILALNQLQRRFTIIIAKPIKQI